MQMDFVKKLFCLDGKKAIVTGGNSGIGMGIAVSLASLGADVAILGRDQKSLNEVEARLRALGTDSKAYRVDVGKKAEIDAFFDRYYAENGKKLDILVANAGISYGKRALETSEAEVDELYDINLKGSLFCCQRASEAMKEQRSGNIVIVTSVNALYPLPPQAVYTSTKAAQEALMQCIAVDLAEYGIRVNTLAPGAVMTNLGRSMPRPSTPPPPPPPPQEGKRPGGIPLGRVGLPEDMGDAVACLVSDAFRYMTGSTVLVDGGLKLRNI
ncbi:MAG: SDR family oxidoreductase [Clostridiales bacterium]|jgi:NAD(P)-dependent dehydrogenase (short-subunit alcohol dehydrogenase family)|nr:SDR family oxidoreductase [Clostridiales bacterium]